MNGKLARRLRRNATEIYTAGAGGELTHRQIYRKLKGNYKRLKREGKL